MITMGPEQTTEPEGGYNVVFEYTSEANGYEGVITWTPFGSKKEFDEWYTPDIKKRQKVIAQGVSDQRAIEYTKSTPLSSYVNAALEESTDRQTGKIHQGFLEAKLNTILLARSPT